uniref:Putative secreted protein n=1 Tax=Anopheles darlingi TaxID=43151 RepID=A0A2M4DC10_ANODA
MPARLCYRCLLLFRWIGVRFSHELCIQVSWNLRFATVRIDGMYRQHNVFHFAAVCDRCQFDDRVKRHFQIR